jgi:hypothetical protein
LSWNLEEAVEHLTMEILLNPNSTTLCYAGCINNSIGGAELATASVAPQVAGDSQVSLRIVPWLVVSPIE